ncbi:MAG: FAD-dependent oxidoreductase [Gemmatimonadota bacterium]|nr:FAD-dependent oxidoreductase [Gemmatimonadota bacterium]MDE2872866.1 FAD-dependent oxidoreductase [Gemmatimonadota bacterium]
MRVGVVGGGVIGLATAWYLKKAGADPFVIEARSVGGRCSQGNPGWICENVFVSTGHQMLGVTLAPSTGRVVAGMIVGDESG